MMGAIKMMRSHILEVSGALDVSNPGNAWYLPPKTVASLRYLGAELEKLETAVDSVDAIPTLDAQEGFAKIEPIAATTLLSWDNLKQKELAKLNAELQLEMRARARTEKMLYQEQKLESIGLLVGGVAHDFNNLFTSIQDTRRQFLNSGTIRNTQDDIHFLPLE